MKNQKYLLSNYAFFDFVLPQKVRQIGLSEVRSVPLLFHRGVVEKGIFRGVEYMLRHSTIYEKTDFYQAANNRIEVSTLCREL